MEWTGHKNSRRATNEFKEQVLPRVREILQSQQWDEDTISAVMGQITLLQPEAKGLINWVNELFGYKAPYTVGPDYDNEYRQKDPTRVTPTQLENPEVMGTGAAEQFRTLTNPLRNMYRYWRGREAS